MRIRALFGPHLLVAVLILLALALPGLPAAAQSAGPTPTPVPPGVPTATPVPPGTPQLSITKSAQPPSAPPGTRITYTITVSNPGAGDAHDVVVTDEFPAELEVVSVTTTKGIATINGQTVQVTIDVLAPGELVSITVTAVVRAGVGEGVIIHNIASVQSTESGAHTATADVAVLRSTLPHSGDTQDSWALAGWAGLLALIAGGLLLGLRRRVGAAR